MEDNRIDNSNIDNSGGIDDDQNNNTYVNQLIKKVQSKRLYKVLQVEPTCSFSEIKESYKRLSLIYHPDRPGGDAHKFKELQSAYEILSNPGLRRIYDGSGEEDISHLHLWSKFEAFPQFIDSYSPHFVMALLDYLFSYKAHVMHSSIHQIWSKQVHNLKFNHTAAFSFFTLLFESIITKIVQKKYGNHQHHHNHSHNQNNIKEDNKNRISLKKAIIIDMISTFLAAPFELAAFHAFTNKFQGSGLTEYFLSGESATKAWLPIKLLLNVNMYFRTFFSRSVLCLAGLVAFRLAFTFTNYFISTLGDYANHQSLMATNRAYNNSYVGVQQSQEEQQNKSIFRKIMDRTVPVLWSLASVTCTAMSYYIPSLLFSPYRMFYILETKQPLGNYFNWSILGRVAILNAFSSFVFDVGTVQSKKFLYENDIL